MSTPVACQYQQAPDEFQADQRAASSARTHLVSAVEEWTHRTGFDDDLTALIVRTK